DRDEGLSMVFVAELERLVLPIGGGAATEVNHHVEDRAARSSNELCLTGPELKVKRSQGPPARARMVVLDEIRVDPELPVMVTAKGLEKKPALVAVDDGLQQHDSVEPGLQAPDVRWWGDRHAGYRSCWP